jgi:hypothetical protein
VVVSQSERDPGPAQTFARPISTSVSGGGRCHGQLALAVPVVDVPVRAPEHHLVVGLPGQTPILSLSG